MRGRKADIAGLLYPRRCPVCHDVVEEPGGLVCEICLTRLSRVRRPSCRKCGKPLLSEDAEYCMDCMKRKHEFRMGCSPFVYDKVMRDSIAAFKYRGRREYAAFYAEEILRACAGDMKSWNAQAFVPIPLHTSRLKKRGYNQAALLTKELSKRCGIAADEKLLVRVKNTRAQKELDDRRRMDNLKGAFTVRGERIPYKRLILVDDIYTTGSTMDAAAGALKEKGAQTVYFLCISVGRGC